MIPDELLKKTLENINKTPVAYNYFFQNIDNAAWLLPLKENGYFKSPLPAIREGGYIQFPVWPESSYLLKVVDKAPNEVLEIIKALPETDNERVMDDVANILLKVSPSKAARYTDQLKGYVNTSQFLMLHRTVSELICRFAENNQFKSALELAKDMLEVLPDPEKDEKLKADYVMIKPTIKYRDYDYKDIVEKITPSLLKAEPIATIDLYAELLQKAIDYELTFFKFEGEETALKEKTDDFSFISRPNIAEEKEYGSDPDDTLTTALRDSALALMQNNTIPDLEKLAKLKELAVNKYSVFKRIVEFALRNYRNQEVFKIFYTSLLKDKKLKSILDSEKNGLNKIESGFVTERPTEVLKGLSNTDLIEKLKTYKDESGWSFERDSIAKELGELIKLNPKRFAPLLKELATTRNEYLNEAIQAFEEAANDLDETSITTILTSLIQIYKSTSVIEESEQHDYYAWSKGTSIRLVEKLLGLKEDKTERTTIGSIAVATELILLLCREDDSADKDDSSFEPVDWSINSTRGKALHATAYLLTWMNRNKADRSMYEPIFTELDWHLVPSNDSELSTRSVYGWRFEVFYGSDQDWAVKNIDTIFSDDELGRAAFDAFVMFSRVHEETLTILGDVFRRQLPRLATPPVETKKSRHDGLKNFTQHLALHYWYTDMDLSKNSMMSVLLKTADKKYIKELANFIGFRLYKTKDTEVEESHASKLVQLWNAIVELTKQDATKVDALEEFGTWFASGKFSPEWSLQQLTYAASKAGNIHLDFAALEHMETLVSEYPAESLKALSAMVDGTRERWSVSSWNKNATAIILAAYNSNDVTTKQQAESLANKLVARGHMEYRDIIT